MMEAVDLTVINETWWSTSHKWNIGRADCSLRGRSKKRCRGAEVVVEVRCVYKSSKLRWYTGECGSLGEE